MANPTAPPSQATRTGRKNSSDTLLERLFREMLRIRVIERRIAERYSEQEMRCPVHLSIGQEAVAVGVCAHLATTDKVMSAHRSHGHYLAKGGNVPAMIAELYGRADGCCGGRGGSMHTHSLCYTGSVLSWQNQQMRCPATTKNLSPIEKQSFPIIEEFYLLCHVQ